MSTSHSGLTASGKALIPGSRYIFKNVFSFSPHRQVLQATDMEFSTWLRCPCLYKINLLPVIPQGLRCCSSVLPSSHRAKKPLTSALFTILHLCIYVSFVVHGRCNFAFDPSCVTVLSFSTLSFLVACLEIEGITD